MKLTKEKTNTIIVKAGTTDEYIYCDFAIVKINRDKLLDLYNRVKTIYKEEDGYNSYYNVNCPFYLEFYQLGSVDGIDEILEQIDEKEWSYINITEEELNQLEEVEDDSICNCLKMEKDGIFRFTGFGKHSGVDYETTSINIKDL